MRVCDLSSYESFDLTAEAANVFAEGAEEILRLPLRSPLRPLRLNASSTKVLQSNSDDPAVQEFLDHAQAVRFAKRADGKDRFDVRFAIYP